MYIVTTFYFRFCIRVRILWWDAGTWSLLLVFDLKEWFVFVHVGLKKIDI